MLEALPAASHPMDVMRTGVSALGCTLPEKEGHTVSGARDIADKLLASLSSILLYWYHYSHNGERIQPETDDDSIGGHFLHLLHGEKPSRSWEKSMHFSLVLKSEATQEKIPKKCLMIFYALLITDLINRTL